MAGGGMGRVLGLGFLFGAKDDGAIRMTEDIGDGMENMARSVKEVDFILSTSTSAFFSDEP